MTPPWRYRILVRLLSPVLFFYTAWRSGKDGGKKYLLQRLGMYTDHAAQGTSVDEKHLWIHAASVGEVFTVLPLIKSVQAHRNDAPLLVTTGTPTGAAVLEQQALSGVRHQYLPIDFPGACQRFIKQANVKEAWIVETEIWPWLYACCKEHSIEITLINGRLSNKTSSQSKGILASSYRSALQGVRVLARSTKDLQRFIELGADADKVQLAGNLKYSATVSSHQQLPLLSKPYVLAASTHADEEMQLAQSWIALGSKHLLVIVPRHPERGATIAKQLQQLGLEVPQRSLEQQPDDNDKLYLADSLGELQAWYQHATAAFVGGSLISRGGHNMLEPARYACPTIVGPHTHNFEDIMPLILEQDAIAVGQDAKAIALFLQRAATHDIALSAMGERAHKFAKDSDNVLQRYESLLLG